MKRILVSILLGVSLGVYADWQTHFGYVNVSQIAVGKDRVFGLSEGLLFSVDKQSEQITEWTKQEGIHGAGIWQIAYDDVSQILLVLYTTGRIDLVSGAEVTHFSDFYNKEMTASKRANNVSFHDGRAYLSLEFGIVSFDMVDHEFVDTYYIADKAAEINVEDVVFKGDSIFAFTADKLYRASLKDNVVDYRCWKTEPLGRIPRDTNKGRQYTDANNDVWLAGGGEGIVRKAYTGERVTYKPKGPIYNIPYYLQCSSEGTLYMLAGGRWAAQYNRPGGVMILQDGEWTNISEGAIIAKTNHPALDFIDVALDPKDSEHYFVTSYGTGVYEFRGANLVKHYTPNNSTLTSVLPNSPTYYTRCCASVCDKDGNLMLIDTSGEGPTIPIRYADGQWGGENVMIDGVQMPIHTPVSMVIDAHHSNLKWFVSGRVMTGLVLWDDNGTLSNPSDDAFIYRSQFMDQNGRTITPSAILALTQDPEGNKWVGTDKGLFVIPADVDWKISNSCLSLSITAPSGDILMEDGEVSAFCFDVEGNVWCGTGQHGVYVLDAERTKVLEHYTSENSIMPSNAVLALACDVNTNRVYIGTGQGLVSYSDRETALTEEERKQMESTDYGSMMRWTLHPAYSEVNVIAASNSDVYAMAGGALFSVNRTDESITYYNKLTGLSGSNIGFITYNKTVDKLLIVYQNGLMDVVDSKGITALSDLYIKGESKEMAVNSIATYKQYVYLAMSFGIVVLDLRKGEIADTYYIGSNASDVDVSSVTVLGDSIYAAAEGRLYMGAMKDNLLDYANWTSSVLPATKGEALLTACHNMLYLWHANKLYHRRNGVWSKHVEGQMYWVHESAGKLLAMMDVKGFVEIGADGSVTVLTNEYHVLDALYDNGEYWLAANAVGLMRYRDKSFQVFQPSGPLTNYSYHLQFAGERLMMAQGGGWASQYDRTGDVIYYDFSGNAWGAIPYIDVLTDLEYIDKYPFTDIMNYAVDPADCNHFFAASYGCGVGEFRGGRAVAVYNEENSTLRSAIENDKFRQYIRTAGVHLDRFGNLWVLNAGSRAAAISLRTPEGKWLARELRVNNTQVKLTTPRGILQDSRYPNSKWFMDCRVTTGVILVDDNGTPLDFTDDNVMKRSEFTDQLGTSFKPTTIHTMAQDKDGLIWVGTDAGPFIIESVESFLKSNLCKRPIIFRNDGTSLVDYSLKSEQINTICVDGGNRKWIGTAGSGVFLMSADGTETICHFTTKNSPLPSDEVLTIAIHPTSGEVFFGTSAGLASFRGDASEPAENYDGVYAYPNPVRPNFDGVITICGLMDNTVVNIIDGGGNLVCKTRSNGGIATWDGKNLHGERVSTGVYTVLCNTADGKGHTVTKIMITY